MKTTLKTSLIALSIAAMPLAANAAGFGRLTVQSALGQPLRAEIELIAEPQELKGLEANIASLDVFKQSSVPFTSFMSDVKVQVSDKGGRPVLKLTSRVPINEPFVDLLLELSWPSGRLVREFTFLLDPPADLRGKGGSIGTALPAVKAPASKAAPKPEPVETVAAAPMPPAEPAPVAEPAPQTRGGKPAKAGKAPVPEVAEKSPETGGSTHEVKRGDTLRSIAEANLQPGVTLDQMLVALFKANPDAFQGNMNRLRTGKVLTIPEQSVVAAEDAKAARREVLAQSQDFSEYRARLAGAAKAGGEPETDSRVSTGQVAPRVEEAPRPGGEPSDVVKVSRSNGSTAGKDAAAAERLRSLEEDIAAREKALKEANSRVNELERSVKELQSLLELRNQAMAKLQESVAAKEKEAAKPAPAPAPAPVAPPPPAPEAAKPAPAPAPTPAPAPLAEVKPAPEAKPAEVKPEPAPAPAPAAVTEPPKPAPKPAPKPEQKPAPKKPAPPPPEPSLLEKLTSDPLMLAGGGGVLAALLGGAFFFMRRKKGAAAPQAPLPEETDPNQPQAVFSTAGGQVVDTAASSSVIATDFSQAGMTSIDADEGVDPVAEADVYMAYGRDAQAEEILVDALKHDPSRVAIHLKLLDIYSQRGNTKQFETTATELYGLTQGTGADWERAAILGRKLDPANPLYAEAGAEGAPAAAPAAAAADPVPSVLDLDVPVDSLAVSAAPAAAAGLTFDLPGEEPAPAPAPQDAGLTFDLPMDAAAPAPAPAPMDLAGEATVLDFDLNFGAEPEPVPSPAPAPRAPVDLPAPSDMDATMVADIRSLTGDGAAAPAQAAEGLMFDFEVPKVVQAPVPAADVGEGFESTDLDFDLSLEETSTSVPTIGAAGASLSGIDLDLPGSGGGAEAGEEAEHVETKLELARAYEEMGDTEGARELLDEVLKEGSAEQQARARELIARLG